ncbi:MAG: DUF2905 domain-containing protein [Bacteroidetes bacterium]|jgi:hypothetical protein|nr:DUF2905 domain-containing protein [Bacteroidota bacterium]
MDGLQGIGKTLVITGGIILLFGLLLMFSEKISFPFFGRLPGDIQIKGKNFQVYFPIASSIILSVVLTLILYLISYFSKR